ncbi:MAG: 4'-phosphopantetheinyl transferase superfamily protein [Flavobacteriales bacterium]
MPIRTHFKPDTDTEIAIWDVTESEVALMRYSKPTPGESDRLKAMCEKRRREWLGIRCCLKHLDIREKIHYTPRGKPYLESRRHISISHACGQVALIVSRDQRVGIDIEKVREKTVGLASKFANESEQKFIPDCKKWDYLHIIWGAKESLYKIWGGQRFVSFRNHMFVKPFAISEKGGLQCRVKDEVSSENADGFYRRIEGVYVVYCTAVER